MPLIQLTICRTQSRYESPFVTNRWINSDLIIHVWENQWYKTQADEDARTNRTGTQINLATDNIMYETLVVEETPTQINDIIAAASGGGGSNNRDLPVGFYTQDVNYQSGTANTFGIFAVAAGGYTVDSVGTKTFFDLTIAERKEYFDLVEKAQAIVITLADTAGTTPETGATTYYIGYSSAILNRVAVSKALPEWIIKRVIEREIGETQISFADAESMAFNKIFDDGTQNYLTYAY